jgi:arsenate reductase
MRVLFLGKGNDCRTLLAETVFNHLAPPGCKAQRASCDRVCPPDPGALALLATQGIRPRAPAAASERTFDDDDVLITVCSASAEQTCPCCMGQALRAHWGIHAPSRRKRLSQDRDAELLDIYHILRVRIERFLELIEAGIEADRTRLRDELARIGCHLP